MRYVLWMICGLLASGVALGQESDPQKAILAEYLANQRKQKAVVAKVRKQFKKPFIRFKPKDYVKFMEGLDLHKDEDLWTWSHVTRIPVLALSKQSTFFNMNAHLIADVAFAKKMAYNALIQLKTSYDRKTGVLQLKSGGKLIPIRKLPKGTIRKTGRTGSSTHNAQFTEDRVVFEVLEPYLLRLKDLANRKQIVLDLKSMPLSAVQVLRGKALFLTNKVGRSYAVAMPVSNDMYKSYVGLQTGAFVDPRRDGKTNLVHELGHVVDYVVLKGGYGNFKNTFQFPAWRKMMPEKNRVFGKRDAKVARTAWGYISRYAMSNAQESFAEHFRAFIQDKAGFRKQAEKEKAEEHPELMQKYEFMEKLLEKTPTTLQKLSAKSIGK